MNKKEIVSRFLTIGFSRDHDAVFLNKIAQSGSDMGNFFFVDTSQPGYSDQVKECLKDSLSLAQSEDGLAIQLDSASGSLSEKMILPKNFSLKTEVEEVK